MDICMLTAIGIYMTSMLIVGFAYSKKNRNVDDFYLGGRKLGPFVTAMSAEASDMSSWLLMGLPGVAYLTGLADATWTGIGLALGTYLNWLIVAKRLRRYTSAVDAFTLPDFFSKRYGDRKNILTAVSAIIIVIFFIPYTASGFAACGKLFNSLFGWDYMTSMIISAVVIVVYCTAGGFLAASTTDFIQSIIMTFALLLVVGVGEGIVGGFEQVFANVSTLDGFLSLGKSYSVETGAAEPYGVLKSISMLAWGLGYFGMPHVLLRFMAIENDKKLKLSRRIASVWVVISLGVAIVIGVVGYSLSQAGIIPTFTDSAASETVIVQIARFIGSTGYVPAFAAGIIIAGIIASTMSTSDSQLLAAASSVSQNLLCEVFHVKISQKAAMRISRFTVIIISAISVVIASNQNSSIFKIVSFAWAGFGATFGPVVLLALFWKRSNRYGAIAGMIAGGAMVFLWKFVIATIGGVFAIYELLPAFIVAIIVNIVVSLITKAPEKTLTDKFDEVRKMA